MLGAVNTWVPFEHHEMTAQVLALEAEGGEVTDQIFEALRSGQKGKRYTPVSDLLHTWCREWLRALIPDDDDYTETFDQTEVLLGALGLDLKNQRTQGGPYIRGPSYGSFTWRDRYSDPNLEQRMLMEVEAMAASWPPVAAGLFGGSADRAQAAFEGFVEVAADVRYRRF
jgi:hypothetical protein